MRAGEPNKVLTSAGVSIIHTLCLFYPQPPSICFRATLKMLMASMLQEIACTAGKIESTFGHCKEDTQTQGGNNASSCPPFPNVNTGALENRFRGSLSARPLQGHVQKGLLALYLAKTKHILQNARHHWQNLFDQFKVAPPVEHMPVLHTSMIRHVNNSFQNIGDTIFAVCDKRLALFHSDVERLAQQESSSTSEDESSATRGHSRLAIAILEKAYAHTTNITKAEKLKLAEVTKLEPRQVTIWVSEARRLIFF